MGWEGQVSPWETGAPNPISSVRRVDANVLVYSTKLDISPKLQTLRSLHCIECRVLVGTVLLPLVVWHTADDHGPLLFELGKVSISLSIWTVSFLL